VSEKAARDHAHQSVSYRPYLTVSTIVRGPKSVNGDRSSRTVDSPRKRPRTVIDSSDDAMYADCNYFSD